MPCKKSIQSMFSSIANNYDILNHILSFGVDSYWQLCMARASGAKEGDLFLDVAAGTCNSAIALGKMGAKVVVTDITIAMLQLGLAKMQHQQVDMFYGAVEADATNLPFKSNIFDGVTICYGIRNIENRNKAYREFLRVLKPQCYLTILEFSQPTSSLLRTLYYIYLKYFVPKIGQLLNKNSDAYKYLSQSIKNFPNQNLLADELNNSGFANINWTKYFGGIVAIHTAQKNTV